MSTAIDDLWPADIASVTEEMPPITILKQQASLLGRKTKNIVEAKVETTSTDIEGVLRHTLYLVAPALNFYRYPLIDVEHKVTSMYPAKVRVRWLEKPRKEPSTLDDIWDLQNAPADNEGEFKNKLKSIFADEETKRVIGVLLAQSVGKKVVGKPQSRLPKVAE
jgi:hypothetical protein